MAGAAPGDGRVIEQRLPVIARWVLYAVGAAEGARRHPVDPVAAWLLRRHPSLLPSMSQAAMLSTLRARTDLIDRMLYDEADRARRTGDVLGVWSFGSGFDARWARLWPAVDDVVREWREIDTGDLLELKNRLLMQSPYAGEWTRVARRSVADEGWTVRHRSPTVPIVVCEAGHGRIEEDLLRAFLSRVRFEAPESRVLLGLPTVSDTDTTWNRRSLASLGWRADEDVQIGTRGRLLAKDGSERCPGMYGFRVVRLVAREPRQR